MQIGLHTQVVFDLWEQATPAGEGPSWERACRGNPNERAPSPLVFLPRMVPDWRICRTSRRRRPGLGGNGGGCSGFGTVGPTIGATAGCGGSPNQPTPTQPEDPKPDTSGTGYTYKPADNDWGYITCPNPTGPDMPEALQEYGPNGQPVGTPIVVCPSQPVPEPNVPPPPPPTPADVWAHVSLPSPALAINPATVGITQLASWFWVTGVGGAVTVTAAINGYSVTTTATPVAYQWNFGDGSTDTSQTPGSESDPSVTHTYDYKGTYIA